VQFDIHDVVLNPDTSVPLGLLLNELVSNAFRHAFPDEREGTIMISMHPNENGSYTLAIRDDGIGMPKGIRIEKIQSLGLLLVSSLVTQLDGTLELKTGKGTEFRIVFNPLKYKERE
jgi:Signal transduction histidine kinase